MRILIYIGKKWSYHLGKKKKKNTQKNKKNNNNKTLRKINELHFTFFRLSTETEILKFLYCS